MYIDMNSPEPYNHQVFLDGEKQLHCIAADNIEGWVERYMLDGDKVLIHGETFATEKVYGKVRIEYLGEVL